MCRDGPAPAFRRHGAGLPGNPLGLKPGQDRFAWAVICWSGPAAEAVMAKRSGASVTDAARWMWALYEAGYSASGPSDDCHQPPATDPGVLAVALSVADANWACIERMAVALTKAVRVGQPTAGLDPAQIRSMVGSREGADIADSFAVWQPAIAELKEHGRSGVIVWP